MELTETPQPLVSTSTIWQRLTIADGLLIMLIGLAAVLRWGWLGMLPLSAEEAAEAVAVYQFGQGSAEFIVGSPTYFNLNTLLQYFLMPTDASVRLLPTMFGLATLLLPWLLRDRIGTVGALVTTLLLAVSPVHQAISRTANGDAIAVFAGLLLFIGWLQWVWSSETRHLIVIAAATALGLSSSALFYSFLDNFVTLWILQRILGPRLHTPRPERDQWQPAAILGTTLFLGCSTLFLWNPAGLGGAANQFAEWLAQFSFGEGFLTPLLATVRYEPMPVLLGIPLIGWLLLDERPLVRWLVYWLFASVLLIAVQAGNVTNVAVLTIPLFMLIGLGADKVFAQRRWTNSNTLLTLIITTWGFVFLVGLGRYMRLDPANIAPLLITFILLIAVGLLMVVLTPDLVQILQSGLLGLLLIGAYLGWGTGWALTHDTGNDPRELWVSDGTDADLRLLHNTVQETSYQISRAQQSLTIISLVDTPAMRWYLRDFDDVVFAEAVARDATRDAIITWADDSPALNGSYARADFDAAVIGVDAGPFNLGETLRWWFFRDNSAELNIDRVALWLRIVEQ